MFSSIWKFHKRFERRNEKGNGMISSKIFLFQKQIVEVKQVNFMLQNEIDELEQYGRRSCVCEGRY